MSTRKRSSKSESSSSSDEPVSTPRKSSRAKSPKAPTPAKKAASPVAAVAASSSPARAVSTPVGTPRSSSTYNRVAASSAESAFVYRRSGDNAAAFAVSRVNGQVRTASWSSKGASGWDAWLSDNESKRKGEIFMLKYSVFWIVFVMLIVWSRAFEHFTKDTYMVVGFVCALPAVFGPLIFIDDEEKKIPYLERWSTKANLWIWINSFNANYFWTHYFYQVLGATYTFPSYRLNDVPINLYFMTHAYFMLYHTASNMALRRLWRAFGNKVTVTSFTVVTIVILIMSYFTAFTETFTIQNFPYYDLACRYEMYVYGSVFYALYFVVSYPMFLRMDEKPGERWTFFQAFVEGMAVSMLITTALDFWRLGIGPICDAALKKAPPTAVPFIPANAPAAPAVAVPKA